MKRLILSLPSLAGAILLFMVSCHRPQPATEAATPSVQQAQAERAAEVLQSTEQQQTYLNKIRQSDELSSLIARTLLDERNQLGLVLFSSVTPDKVPALMRTVMTEMAQGFPRQNVDLDVYASATPPQKIGRAHLDGQTGEVTYTPEK